MFLNYIYNIISKDIFPEDDIQRQKWNYMYMYLWCPNFLHSSDAFFLRTPGFRSTFSWNNWQTVCAPWNTWKIFLSSCGTRETSMLEVCFLFLYKHRIPYDQTSRVCLHVYCQWSSLISFPTMDTFLKSFLIPGVFKIQNSIFF